MNVQTFYDRYWDSGLHGNPAWSERQFRRMMQPIIGRNSALDYGCGLGYSYQKQLAASVKNYVGADAGPKAVENARQKGYSAILINADTGAIEAPDQSFEAATCIEVFEHLFDPLQSARELYRVLKPGGVFVATVPNFGYLPHRIRAFTRAQVPSEPENPKLNRFNGVHIRFFSAFILKRLLQDAGFINVKVDGWDNSSIWHLWWCAGPWSGMSDFAEKHFPNFLHLRFLQDISPNFFAMRLRAVGYKPR